MQYNSRKKGICPTTRWLQHSSQDHTLKKFYKNCCSNANLFYGNQWCLYFSNLLGIYSNKCSFIDRKLSILDNVLLKLLMESQLLFQLFLSFPICFLYMFVLQLQQIFQRSWNKFKVKMGFIGWIDRPISVCIFVLQRTNLDRFCIVFRLCCSCWKSHLNSFNLSGIIWNTILFSWKVILVKFRALLFNLDMFMIMHPGSRKKQKSM